MQTILTKHIQIQGTHAIEVHIPQSTTNATYVEILLQLLELSEDLQEATWIIDLSEHQGISVALGGMLMNLVKMARVRGRTIKITGIQHIAPVFSPVDSEWMSHFDMKLVSNDGYFEVTLQPFTSM